MYNASDDPPHPLVLWLIVVHCGAGAGRPAIGVPRKVYTFKTHFVNTILDVLLAQGWLQTSEETGWDYHWADVGWVRESYRPALLADHARICHFPNHYELTRKDLVMKNLKRFARQKEREPGKVRGWCIQHDTLILVGVCSERVSSSGPLHFAHPSSRSLIHASAIFLLHSHQSAWAALRYLAPDREIMPQTFHLPSEYAMFVEEYKRAGPSVTWIMKPSGRAQGKGIFLVAKLADVLDWRTQPIRLDGGPVHHDPVAAAPPATTTTPAVASIAGPADGPAPSVPSSSASSAAAPGGAAEPDDDKVESYIAQRYLSRPYLIGGKKFDMRIYVLVSSFVPLRVWLYREAFARFAGVLFSMDKKDVTNNVIHLTNVAIQKTAEGYDKTKGCKWLFHQVCTCARGRDGMGVGEWMHIAAPQTCVSFPNTYLLIARTPSHLARNHGDFALFPPCHWMSHCTQ